MVGLQTLNLAIGVRVPASQPKIFPSRYRQRRRLLLFRDRVVVSNCNQEALICRPDNLLVPMAFGKSGSVPLVARTTHFLRVLAAFFAERERDAAERLAAALRA
jgi:hypothetical protein